MARNSASAMPTLTEHRPAKLGGVEAARGIAALLVVLVHASAMLAEPKYFGHLPFAGLFKFGHAGVDFFFILSGFIIYYVHHQDIDRPSRLPGYYWKRFVRIYPSYWLATAIWGTILVFSPTKDRAEQQLATILTSAFLLPLRETPILDVAWTLKHELLFYVLFGVLLMQRRLGCAAMAGWGLLVAWNIGVATTTGTPYFSGVPGELFFRLFNIEFFCGILVGYLVLYKNRRAPQVLLIAGILIFFGSGILEAWGPRMRAEWPPSHLGYAVGGTLALYGLVCLEEAGRLAVPALLKFLGAASYSIYLVHAIVIQILQQLLLRAREFMTFQLELTFVLFVAAAVIVGVVFSHVVEQPLLRRYRNGIQISFGRRASAVETFVSRLSGTSGHQAAQRHAGDQTVLQAAVGSSLHQNGADQA